MKSFLIENFNTSNQTIPLALPHEKLVVYIEENTCAMVQKLDYMDRCHHVLSHDDCNGNVHYVHYIRFLYCTLNPKNQTAHVFSVLFLSLIMCCMFVVLGATADKFFCPALTALAKWLKMNENVAGLTLLAFGNGSPDILTSIVAEPEEVGLVFAEGFGGSCIVSGLGVALIVIVRPCTVFAPTFLRDMLFFILGIVVVDVAMVDGYITLVECVGKEL